MIRYPKIGFVNKSLATFRAHDGSITINASLENKKSLNIEQAYDEVKRYYREIKLMRLIRRILGYN